MNSKLILGSLILFALSISTAFAHPGPPGHTHADDWPFGYFIAGVVLLAAAFFFGRKTKKL